MTAVIHGRSKAIVATHISTTPPATSLAATSLTGLGKENSDSRIAPSDYEKAALLRGLFISGAEGARTPDLLAASQTLSQLSYSPKFILRGPVYPAGLIVPGRPLRRSFSGGCGSCERGPLLFTTHGGTVIPDAEPCRRERGHEDSRPATLTLDQAPRRPRKRVPQAAGTASLALTVAGDELGHVDVAAGHGAGATGAGVGFEAPCATAALRVDLGDHRLMRGLDVAQELLGVGAQRRRQIAQVARELGALGEYVTGSAASVGERRARLVLCRGANLARLLVGGIQRLGHQARALLLGLLAQARRLAGEPRGLVARLLEDLRRLLLGRAHAVVGGAVGLGDPLARAGLGLGPELLGGMLGGLDDLPDAGGYIHGGQD